MMKMEGEVRSLKLMQETLLRTTLDEGNKASRGRAWDVSHLEGQIEALTWVLGEASK
jgi:hypothetical protein